MTIARKTVMISSTARDLPEHRKEVMDACLRQGMFPIMMEHLPANDDDAISASLKMVDEADIYVGIFAQRYGYIPKGKKRNPKQISITEMEYDHAVKRKIPCLLFVMDKSHPITIDDIDMENAVKLKKFKDRIQTKTVVNFFKSSADLRSLVINSLSKHLESTPITIPDKESSVIDVTAYFNALRKRYNVLALEGLTPPQKEEYLQIQLRSVFVEQSVREDTPPVELPKEVWEKLSREQEIHDEDLPSGITLDDVRKARDSYYQKPSRLVLDALADSRCQYTIILGDPGSGKSTLARYVMLSLINPLLVGDKIQKSFEGYLPLLIELRTFAGLCADNKCETPLEFFEYLGKTEGWGLTQTALHNHLKNDGRAVVIFDGLDEIFEPKMREMITNQIVGFTNTYPKARVIVTSRILGYRRKILSDAGFVHFTLQDLNEEQVKTFITQWYQLAMQERLDEAKERSERILKSFADSASIRQLAGNPMLLTIMAIIGKHQELPRERWKLYDHAASVLIQHWDVNKHLKDENLEADFIDEDDKKELLRRLAYRMQSGDGGLAGNYIHREGLQEEFESYLKERYSQAPDRAKVIAEAMIQQFRERNFILSLYGANVFGFVHRAFLEYFCASAFVWKFEKTKELDIEYLKTNVYGKHWEDQSWHEVLRLICGMTDEKWVAEIVVYLASPARSQWPHKWGDNLPWNIALSVQCLGEVRNIISIDKSAQKVLQILCKFYAHKHKKRKGEIDIPTPRALTERFEFAQQVERAAEIIGNKWPHRSLLTNWVKGLKSFEDVLMHPQSVGTFVGTVGAGLPELGQLLLDFTHHSNEYFQVMSLSAISKGWQSESTTLDILYKHLKDNSSFVRRTVLDCLGEYFYESPRTILVLTESINNEKDPNVAGNSIRILAKRFSQDLYVKKFLQETAINHPVDFVRGASLDSLATYYRDKNETLELLIDRGLNDKSGSVRGDVIWTLTRYFRSNVRTFRLVFDRAVNDKTPKSEDKEYAVRVREVAIETIAENWPDHPDTLSLLRDRAKNDPTPWLRERCKELIEEIEGKKA